MEAEGFDETLRGCGDYDLYLRITKKYNIAAYPVIVAEYRRHGQNMSSNYGKMLREALHVLDRHEQRIVPTAAELTALQQGRAHSRGYWSSKMIETARAHPASLGAIGLLAQAVKSSPTTAVPRLLWHAVRVLKGSAPSV